MKTRNYGRYREVTFKGIKYTTYNFVLIFSYASGIAISVSQSVLHFCPDKKYLSNHLLDCHEIM